MKLSKVVSVTLCLLLFSSIEICSLASCLVDENYTEANYSEAGSGSSTFCVTHYSLWADEVTDVRSLTEDDINVFYISRIGLVRLDKTTGQKSLIIKNTKLSSFQIYGDSIHYCVDKTTLYHSNLNGGNQQRIVSIGNLNDFVIYENRIDRFEVYKEYVYIKTSGCSFIRLNITTGLAETFIDDFDSYAFLDNYCYFVEHAMRTYSIYRKDIYSGDVELIRGDGITKSNLPPTEYDNYEWYNSVFAVDGELYYTRRVPDRVYRLSLNEEDCLIMNFEHIETKVHMCVTYSSGKIYCTILDSTYCAILYEYDIQTCSLTELAALKGYLHGAHFVIVNDYAFYHTEYNAFSYIRIDH